jgi:8-amino-7-oxononanoate synthase
LGKSFGVGGAFVAGSGSLIRWLWNRARSFVFSTGISPILAEGALASLTVIREGTLTRKLHENVGVLREALSGLGLAAGSKSVGPILPLILGEPSAAVDAAQRLRDLGVLAQAIRPPTVPPGTARLRLVAQAGHDPEALRRAAQAIRQSIP